MAAGARGVRLAETKKPPNASRARTHSSAIHPLTALASVSIA